jgi:selenocysteine-specific elongation factor
MRRGSASYCGRFGSALKGMNSCCVAVIGHVDHGKTSLVRALTGIETDRLAEEKARGLSITPGFAHRLYVSGTIDFIDVPGHEDFIQAMISGASGARAVLVVVSLVEGVQPQSIEHLRIARLLGITHGVIAVTKSDLMRCSEKPEQEKAIKTALALTGFADVPMIACSAETGEAIDRLQIALEGLLSGGQLMPAPQHAFLPVDRVFSRAGLGAVVTGTLLGNAITVGDAVAVQPTGQQTTIKALQSRNQACDQAIPGSRVAINLRGVSVAEIKRGAVVTVPGGASGSACFDVGLNEGALVLKHMDSVRVHCGTQNAVAQVRLFRGASGLAQLRFKEPVVGFAGQRLIIRQLSPSRTLGGAVILDPNARPTGAGDVSRVDVLQATQMGDLVAIATALSGSARGVTDVRQVARLARMSVNHVSTRLAETYQRLEADWMTPKARADTCRDDLLSLLSTYHQDHPLHLAAPHAAVLSRGHAPMLTAYVMKCLLAEGIVRKNDNMYALAAHDPFTGMNNAQHARMTELEDAFAQADLVPLSVLDLVSDETDLALIDLLIATNSLVKLRNIALKQTLILHKDAIDKAAEMLLDAFAAPLDFTTSQARTTLGTSRKVVVPLLEHFDSKALTLRTGNTRHFRSAI